MKRIKSLATHPAAVLAYGILAALLLRAATLETPDLVDTTEGRYAAIAHQMYRTADFVIPQIPKDAYYEPYLGKPPLHFWLMSAAYDLFGADEWTSRLPSFLGLAIIVLLFLWLGRRLDNPLLGPLAALLTISSGLMFFFSGAVVLDVSFSAAISAALVSFFIGARAAAAGRSAGLPTLFLFWAALGIGFLIKGPAVLMYVGGVLGLWCLFRRGWTGVGAFLQPSGILLFLAVTLPWFTIAEMRHPGLLKYFFLNENLLRYAAEEYGDRYGTGHVRFYGSVWLMFMGAFLPWTLLLLPAVKSVLSSAARREFRGNDVLTFGAAWLLAPLILLTFMRQLHAGYVLPAIPGAALLLATRIADTPERYLGFLRKIGWTSVVLGAGAGLAVPFVSDNASTLQLVIVAGAMLVLVLIYRQRPATPLAIMTGAPLAVTLLFTAAVLISPLFVNGRRSTEKILACVVAQSGSTQPRVAMFSTRSYSARFFSEAWSSELGRPVLLELVTPESLLALEIPNLVVRERDRGLVPEQFQLRGRYGEWLWLVRSAEPLAPIICSGKERV